MADFFARVELHGASWPDDYESLHNALAKHGFTSCLPVDQGGSKRLATGFYYSTNRVDDIARVATAVKACADATGYRSEIIVVKSAGAHSYLSRAC